MKKKDYIIKMEEGGFHNPKGMFWNGTKWVKHAGSGTFSGGTYFKDGGWIQKAVNPEHKGFCSPMTKKTCTLHRRALAKTFKKHHGFHEMGGPVDLNHPLHKFADGGIILPSNNGEPEESPIMPDPLPGPVPTPYNPQTGLQQQLTDPQNQPLPGTAQQDAQWRAGMTDQEAQANIMAGSQPVVKQKRNPVGAGLMTSSYFNDQKNQRQLAGYTRQMGMSSNMQHVSGSKGDYNQQGIYHPGQNVPTMAGNFMKNGGKVNYVNSSKDPRYKAYQDSLTLYGFQKRMGADDNQAPLVGNVSLDQDVSSTFSKEELQAINRLSKLDPKIGKLVNSDGSYDAFGMPYSVRPFKKPKEEISVRKIQPRIKKQSVSVQTQGSMFPTDYNFQPAQEIPYTDDANYNNEVMDDYHRKQRGLMEYGGVPQYAMGGMYGKQNPDSLTLNTNWKYFTNSQGQPDAYKTGRALPESDNPDIIVEKNEQVIGDFDGDGSAELMGVNTGSHASGQDQGVNVPVNSFVFSDTPSLKIKDPEVLKMFGAEKPSTPAKLAKSYDLQKYKSVIDNPQADNLSKKTAELMTSNLNNKLQQLGAVQESMKEEKVMKTMAKKGGMYATGGYGPTLPSYGYGDILSEQQDMLKNKPDAVAFANFLYGNPDAGSFADGRDGRRTELVRNINPEGYSRLQSPEIPKLPMSGEQYPTNDPTNAQPVVIGDNLGSFTKPAGQPGMSKPATLDTSDKGFQYSTPYKLGMANAVLNLATIHKYLPWESPVNSVLPETAFLDPTRELAANSEIANSQGLYGAISGNSRAARANQSQTQGQALTNAANILGRYQNQNVQIANQANQNAANITNQTAQQQRDRMNRLYQGNVVANQQYQNAEREGRAALLQSYTGAFTNRMNTDLINKNSPYFYIDPSTGRRIFKSKEAEATFNNVMSGKGDGASGTSYNDIKNGLIAQGMDDERASDMAERILSNRIGLEQRTTYGPTGQVVKRTNKGKMGGPISDTLMKFVK